MPDGIVGSQLLASLLLDANGNAAALPLATFFDVDVRGVKLRDLILSEHKSLKGVFADKAEVSDAYSKAFKQALEGANEKPTTHARNKQLLWPLKNARCDDHYHCLVPLYPSSLTHSVYQTINNQRFSDDNKQARENRKKNNVQQKPYVSFVNLAATKLGGTKPQNVSLLSSRQSGRNFLLESLPPVYKSRYEFSLSKKQENFFSKSLAYHCYEGLQDLYAVIESSENMQKARDLRKQALNTILGQLLQQADYVQTHYAAGWSEGYSLKMAHKYWLDPRREELEGQENFRKKRHETDWVCSVMDDFALWLNGCLKRKFPKQAAAFDDAEYREWLREIEKAIKASQRMKQGVFL
ncbi:CRISPR-associated protein Csy1 [invertebrate metagenome]|uniref:CRISPR-associated protein Csy1 n=1 Tax=invertebrate metagenome TaxID=1711999 RepID=A0A2H9T5X2_9ZZZZ